MDRRQAPLAASASEWNALARSYFTATNFSDRFLNLRRAAEALEVSLHLQPGDALTWGMAADTYHELGHQNFSFTLRAIECCHASLRLQPSGSESVPMWTNLAKILTEAGHHVEAVDAAARAASQDGSLHVRYQYAEALLDAKRHAEAQRSYRGIVMHRESRTFPELPDAHNHLATSLLVKSASASRRHLRHRHGRTSSAEDAHDLASVSSSLDGAMHALRSALRLNPACRYNHARNYYQVLANALHARHGIDYATAALWPVAAMTWGVGSPASSAATMRAGFDALSRSQRESGDVAAQLVTRTLLRSLGAPFSIEASGREDASGTSAGKTPGPPPSGDLPHGRRALPSLAQLVQQTQRAARKAATEARAASPPSFAERAHTRDDDSLKDMSPMADEAEDSPPHPLGVIAYVCCADNAEVTDLRRSIRLLHVHFNWAARYPVIVFHDMLSKEQMRAIRRDARPPGNASMEKEEEADEMVGVDEDSMAAAPSLVSFEWLADDVFSLPPHLSATQRAAIPKAVRGYGMGYRHMCRTFCGPLFRHPALRRFEYIWRLDSDSFLLAPPLADPFSELHRRNASYGWVHAYRDEAVFVTGLWAQTKRFLDARGVDEAAIHAWVPGGKKWYETPMCFATNCFVARLSWFASETYWRYFEALDATGGFYAYRWGDACVHMLAVAALLPRQAVVRLSSLAYWHQGTVVLPSTQRAAASSLLAGEGDVYNDARTPPPGAARLRSAALPKMFASSQDSTSAS